MSRSEKCGHGRARQAFQHKRASSLRGAHFQVVHVLRPLRLAFVGRVASRLAMRGMQNELAQTLPKKCGQQLWHQPETNSASLAAARRLRRSAAESRTVS